MEYGNAGAEEQRILMAQFYILFYREAKAAFSFKEHFKMLPAELWNDWLEEHKPNILTEGTETRKIFLSIWEGAEPGHCPDSVREVLDDIFDKEEEVTKLREKIAVKVEGVLSEGETEEESVNPELAQELNISTDLTDRLKEHQRQLSKIWPQIKEILLSSDQEERKLIIEKLLFNVDNEFAGALMRCLNVLPATRKQDMEELRDFFEQANRAIRCIDHESQEKWGDGMVASQVFLVNSPEGIVAIYKHVNDIKEEDDSHVHGIEKRAVTREMKAKLGQHYKIDGQNKLLFHARAFLLPPLLGQHFNRNVPLAIQDGEQVVSRIQSGHVLGTTLEALKDVFFHEHTGEESMNFFLLLIHDYRNFSDEQKKICLEYLSFLLYREGVSAYSFRHHLINFPQSFWEDWIAACEGEKLLVGRPELVKVLISLWRGTSKKQRPKGLNQVMVEVLPPSWDEEKKVLQSSGGGGKQGARKTPPKVPSQREKSSLLILGKKEKVQPSSPKITHQKGRTFSISDIPEGVILFVRWKEKISKGPMSQPIPCEVSSQGEVVLPKGVVLAPGRGYEACFFFITGKSDNRGSVIIPDPSARTELTFTLPKKEKVQQSPVSVHSANTLSEQLPSDSEPILNEGEVVNEPLPELTPEEVPAAPLAEEIEIAPMTNPSPKQREYSFEDQQGLLSLAVDEYEGQWERIIETDDVPDASQDKPGTICRSFAFTPSFLQEIIETTDFPRITVQFGTYKDPERIQKITPENLSPELSEKLKRIASEMILPTYEFREALGGLTALEPELLRLKKSSQEYARLWRMMHPAEAEKNPYQKYLEKSWGFPSWIVTALTKFGPEIKKEEHGLPSIFLFKEGKYQIRGEWKNVKPEAKVGGKKLIYPSLSAELQQWGTLLYQAYLGYLVDGDIQKLREESYKKIQRKTRESTWENIINNEGRTPEYDQGRDNLVGVRKKRTREEMEEEGGDVLIQDLKFLFPDNRGLENTLSIALSASTERYEDFRNLLEKVERDRKYFIARIISTAKEMRRAAGLNEMTTATYKGKEPIHSDKMKELLVALSGHLPSVSWEMLGKIGNGNGRKNGGVDEKKMKDLLSQEYQVNGKHWLDYLVDEMEKAEIPIGIYYEITVEYEDLKNEAIQQRWKGTEGME